MTNEIIDWTLSLRSPDGRVVFEQDAKVHVEIVGYSEPELRRIDHIFCSAWSPLHRDSVAIDILDSDAGHSLNAVGKVMAEVLLTDPDFEAAAIEKAGWVYSSRGSNDPEGHWRQAAE